VSIDHDALWKDIITELFEDFVDHFLPDLYPEIDFSKGYESLEQEFKKLFPESEKSKVRNDKLVKVFLKDGTEQWILIHLEVQGYTEEDFSERMFVYYYRIFDRYHKKVVALAVFTDDSPKFKPNQYQYSFYQTEHTYKYRTYKILDADEEKLIKTANPFGLVVLAGLYSIKSRRKKDEFKYQFKIKLMRLLREHHYNREQIHLMFIFIDSIIQLPDDLEIQLQKETNQIFEGDETMSVLTMENTNFAQAYISKGIEQGIEKGKKEGIVLEKQFVLIRQLKRKFGLSEEEESLIRNITNLDALDHAIDEILFAETKEEVLNCLIKK